MRSKIMTHFSNFVISFLNDYGKKFYPEEKNDFFKKVDYKLRNKVNADSINNIMQKTLKEFCKLKVSTKHKNCENLNLNSLNLLSNYFKNNFEENFLKKKISDFYQDFYCSEDVEKLVRDYGITNQTKNFQSLLEKFNNEPEYKKTLKETGYTLIAFANLSTKEEEEISEKKLLNQEEHNIIGPETEINIGVEDENTNTFFYNNETYYLHD